MWVLHEHIIGSEKVEHLEELLEAALLVYIQNKTILWHSKKSLLQSLGEIASRFTRVEVLQQNWGTTAIILSQR